MVAHPGNPFRGLVHPTVMKQWINTTDIPLKEQGIYIYSHTTNKIPVVKAISSWFLTTNLTVGFIMDIKLWKLTNIRLVCWSALWGIVDIFISIIYRRVYIYITIIL